MLEVFEFEDAAGADGGADAAADAGGTFDVFATLGIGAYIDAHLAIGAAVTTRDALRPIGGDAET